MASPFANQPLFCPLRPLLDHLPENGSTPPLDWLNALAAERGIVTGSAAPLRFVTPGSSGLSYEERIWWLGEVETRPGNWHDGFNALVWLSFPRSKAALNARHHQALLELQQSATIPAMQAAEKRRGPLRDALTQFDECGVAVVAANPELWQGIQAHRWKDVFWNRRAEVRRSLGVWIFGHASYDLLRTPHLGLCSKAVFFHVAADWFALPVEQQRLDIDARIAQRFGSPLRADRKPEYFQPLPLLGIPGATPDNEFPAYYDNTRQFRPLRAVPSPCLPVPAA